MDIVRGSMRLVGRLSVVGLLVVMILGCYSSPESAHEAYMGKYDNFRMMLYLGRIADLPPARYVKQL